jgi:5'-3' exonuclease
MNVHLIDGTYELFRHFFAIPSSTDVNGQEIAAVRGVLNSVLSMFERGSTHMGVATDHIVESFRNELYAGYKTSEGMAPELLSQFPILEEALDTMGVLVWPMVYYEADDALAAAAAKAALDSHVNQVIICTPDKDLSQCVDGDRVVQLDRRRDLLRDEAAVVAKFGVRPPSIPGLSCSRRRQRRWLPRHSRLGTKGRRAHLEPIWSLGLDSERLENMAPVHSGFAEALRGALRRVG